MINAQQQLQQKQIQRQSAQVSKAASMPGLNGGSSQQVGVDLNGMTTLSNPVKQPFSPASARTFDLNQQQPMVPKNPKRMQGLMNSLSKYAGQ